MVVDFTLCGLLGSPTDPFIHYTINARGMYEDEKTHEAFGYLDDDFVNMAPIPMFEGYRIKSIAAVAKGGTQVTLTTRNRKTGAISPRKRTGYESVLDLIVEEDGVNLRIAGVPTWVTICYEPLG